jgi:glycine/sarcosine N-methyltransferase
MGLFFINDKPHCLNSYFFAIMRIISLKIQLGGNSMSFYQQLSQYYDQLFPANPAQIRLIEKHASPSARILDIAAGTGNQALLLADNGYNVTATDSSEDRIRKMEEKSLANDIPIQTLLVDMENIQTITSTFDVIVCIGNSLSHLTNLNAINETVKDVAKLLESDGTFIVQIVNFDRVIEEKIHSLPIIQKPNGLTFERTYEFQQEQILFHGTLSVEEDGERRQFDNKVPLYPLQSFQLVSILQNNGFSEISLFGDYQESEYTLSSPAIVIVAKK